MISKGNHIKFTRFVLFAINEEAKTWLLFLCHSMYNKTILLDLVSVISRIINISLGLQLWLVTLAETLIILDITKTSSNNCLIILIHLDFYYFLCSYSFNWEYNQTLKIAFDHSSKHLEVHQNTLLHIDFQLSWCLEKSSNTVFCVWYITSRPNPQD